MRRTTWAAASAVLLLVLAGCGPEAGPTGSTGPGPTDEAGDDRSWRWVALRDVEVQVPAGWAEDHAAARPDCIQDGGPRDPWAGDVPDRPSVMLGTPNRPVPLIGCSPERAHDPAFGDLPFDLWQPYVALAATGPDLAEEPGAREGRWEHRGWRLTRATVGDVVVSVLAAPDDPDLTERVHGSVRRVEVTALGCDPASPVQAERFTAPDGAPVPPSDEVAAVAVCDYSRVPGRSGLEGSRRITGDEARDLARAVAQAPTGGGPDRPRSCSPDLHGDRAIALRFFGEPDETATPLGEAFVYHDWCFGNGIVDSQGMRTLTRESCAPLFAEPPITLWSGHQPVVDVCGPLAAGR